MSPYMLVFCQVVVGCVFALSVLGKVRDMSAFEESIQGFQLLPEPAIKPSAITFVVSEMIVVVLLLVGGVALPVGFVLAVVLLALFSGALFSVLQRKLDVSCGCFGASEQRVSYYDIVRNGGFMVCAIGGVWLATTTVLPGWEGFLLAGSAIAFVLVWTHLRDIVGVLRLKP
ncbi:MAG: MauE/DoxX family redox-associated membrane protein [Chloroflexota bacterium]